MRMPFRFVTDVQLPGNGIFLSALSDGRAYYRKDHITTALKRGHLNENWELIPDSDWEKPGWEDPRVCTWRGRSYFTNNFINQCGMCDMDTGEEIKIYLNGKNFTYLPGDELSVISWFNPLEVHRLTSGTPKLLIKRRFPDSHLPDSASWRGGTAGLMLEPGLFVGFGHRTVQEGDTLRHLPFVWRLRTKGRRYRLEAHLVDLPEMWPLCDPTCIIERGGNWYLITAQSPLAWFVDQPLRTAVYEFSWQTVFEQYGRNTPRSLMSRIAARVTFQKRRK